MDKNYIEWIGTGSGLNPILGNTSFIVKGESNRTLLVDCGSTVPIRLIEKNQIGEITDVIITHQHADHIGGLEGLAFMSYFGLKNRDEKRPNLYVGTENFANKLWENSLKGGMEDLQTDEGLPFKATLETFFKVNIGKEIEIEGLPKIELFDTLHVQGLENYGVKFSNGIFYSGDTKELPNFDSKIIFQDCQFYENGVSDVHISYNTLKNMLPMEVKAKTYLVHLGGGYEKINPKKDGFAGFIEPGDKFRF